MENVSGATKIDATNITYMPQSSFRGLWVLDEIIQALSAVVLSCEVYVVSRAGQPHHARRRTHRNGGSFASTHVTVCRLV